MINPVIFAEMDAYPESLEETSDFPAGYRLFNAENQRIIRLMTPTGI